MNPNSFLRRHAEVYLAVGATLLVVLIRLWFARHMNSCGVPDSCAYLGLAESIARNHSFSERFLFDFQLDHLNFPTHGIEYWRPGTSFFFLMAQPLMGVTLHSSLLVTILAGVFLAWAAWRIAMNFTEDRSIACASYLLCLVLPPLWDSSMIPDSGLFYAAFVAWFLALFTVRFQSYLHDLLALVCLSIAYLIRNDAILLLVPFAVVLVLRLRKRQEKGSSPLYGLMMIAGFLIALIPMHLIYAKVLGTAFPSGSSKVLFMNSLDDFTLYQAPVNIHTWLAAGVGHLIKMRIATLPLILYRILFIVTGFGILFLPVLAIRRSDGTRTLLPEYAGSLTFAGTIVLVYSAILPAIGVFSALRTYMGLIPFVAVCIVLGIRAVAGSSQTTRVLTGTVCLIYFTMGVMGDRRTTNDATDNVTSYSHIVTFLASRNATPESGAVVMTTNPVQFYEATKFPTVQLPSNGEDAIRNASDDFHITHVLIDADMDEERLHKLTTALRPVDISSIPQAHTLVFTLPTDQAKSELAR